MGLTGHAALLGERVTWELQESGVHMGLPRVSKGQCAESPQSKLPGWGQRLGVRLAGRPVATAQKVLQALSPRQAGLCSVIFSFYELFWSKGFFAMRQRQDKFTQRGSVTGPAGLPEDEACHLLPASPAPQEAATLCSERYLAALCDSCCESGASCRFQSIPPRPLPWLHPSGQPQRRGGHTAAHGSTSGVRGPA